MVASAAPAEGIQWVETPIACVMFEKNYWGCPGTAVDFNMAIIITSREFVVHIAR
jgi:hypothetical protein